VTAIVMLLLMVVTMRVVYSHYFAYETVT